MVKSGKNDTKTSFRMTHAMFCAVDLSYITDKHIVTSDFWANINSHGGINVRFYVESH
jgi:hypothetical protein